MFRQLALRVPAGARALSTTASRSNLARMQIMGRLVADPEIKTSVNGKEFTSYVVATTDYLGSREDRASSAQTSTYHRIYAFGDKTDKVKTLTKGTRVFVEADFRIERQPGEDGQPPRDRLLVSQRSVNVISRPKPVDA
ncbi:hypothetical protein K437DRAFT_246438 [Tilletiaria anomala UBC 951]|uniref:Nucleic acid-binding protein n=1 Tax=Tilletiaria anomala (strain ATCC 24038 / CBS 436.72 / UBC 951) TaxID=1037660 RepID=A0A066W773_TILAU|nr:uncharacterized protein K437DRAFT_246438 [Tilletiaria anomala UBC 951]KDN46645.1 hypothetical protein K437DRAFT_246438 [Tilletiaria anomala UBC 951]